MKFGFLVLPLVFMMACLPGKVSKLKDSKDCLIYPAEDHAVSLAKWQKHSPEGRVFLLGDNESQSVASLPEVIEEIRVVDDQVELDLPATAIELDKKTAGKKAKPHEERKVCRVAKIVGILSFGSAEAGIITWNVLTWQKYKKSASKADIAASEALLGGEDKVQEGKRKKPVLMSVLSGVFAIPVGLLARVVGNSVYMGIVCR